MKCLKFTCDGKFWSLFWPLDFFWLTRDIDGRLLNSLMAGLLAWNAGLFYNGLVSVEGAFDSWWSVEVVLISPVGIVHVTLVGLRSLYVRLVLWTKILEVLLLNLLGVFELFIPKILKPQHELWLFIIPLLLLLKLVVLIKGRKHVVL